MLRVITKSIADFFLPRLCETCNEKLSVDEQIICNNCFSIIDKAPADMIRFEYDRKFAAHGFIEKFTTAFVFKTEGILQQLLHQLKYNKKFAIGQYLGTQIVKSQSIFFREYRPDLILPVPLHSLKHAERGYNQSYYIAKGIASMIALPVNNGIVERIRYTESQTRLGIEARIQNVSGVFGIKKPGVIEGKNVLLVDDVITTGATISELAKILKADGCAKVYAASVAVADFTTSSQAQTTQV